MFNLRIDSRYATSSFKQSLKLPFLGLLAGTLCGHAALALVWLIDTINQLVFVRGELASELATGAPLYAIIGALPGLYLVAVTTTGGVIIGLLRWWFALKHIPGPAELIATSRAGEGQLDIRSGLLGAMVSSLSIGFGASLGRYGPTVHLGATLSAWLSKKLDLDRAHRMALLGCGAAAGISASFNAPLAGVIFVHELILDSFARRSFVAITIASVTGAAIADAYDAGYQLISLSSGHIDHTYEYIALALVGALGALAATLLIKSMEFSTQLAARSGFNPIVTTALGGLILGLVAIPFPHIIGLGDAAIHDALAGNIALQTLIALVFAKLFAASVCIASGFGGGVFGPALFIGAMLGSAAGRRATCAVSTMGLGAGGLCRRRNGRGNQLYYRRTADNHFDRI